MGRVLAELLPGAHVSLSHEIVREYREYERMSTTVLNAYIGPRASEYLAGLEEGLDEPRLRRPAADHAVQRRRDGAGDGEAHAGRDDGIGPGRRRHRRGPRRRAGSASRT